MIDLESDLAPPVAAFHVKEGGTNYFEVSVDPRLRDAVNMNASRADMVTVTSGELIAVTELKIDLSWALLLQATLWRHHAHMVWIAVAEAKQTPGRLFAIDCARRYGLGVLEVDARARVNVHHRPVIRRPEDISDALRASLTEGHKRDLAICGTNRGGHATRERTTHDSLATYAAAHSGASLLQALQATKHHYRNVNEAAKALEKLIRKGKIPGVHLGKGRIYPTAEEARRGFVEDEGRDRS